MAMMLPEAVRERGRVCSGSSAGFPPLPPARSKDGGFRNTAVGASDSATSSCAQMPQLYAARLGNESPSGEQAGSQRLY